MSSTVSVPMPEEPRGKQPELVVDLADIYPDMLPVAGGKAVNLGEMLRAGLPVPPGVCVTTEAYSQIASAAAIDFDALAQADSANVELLARQVREALMAVPMPASIAHSILEAYGGLGSNVPVAVRSSATAEDLPNASFAGQQDTYLHIIGGTEVMDAVRRCWASLWTERAVVYRSTNGIDHRAVRIAVVIQRMIESKIAGVLFTANPVTGRRRQAVIDANPGLGEAVVSGAVNPDHFVVNTDTGEIVEQRLGEKRIEVRPLPGGGTETIEGTYEGERSCITDVQIRALAKLGNEVEQHFGRPQDTEWAIDAGGALWLTQARPITTLFPLPAKPPSQDFRVYFCFSVAQGLYRPFTPMGLAVMRMLASSTARELGIPVEDPFSGPPVYAEAGQRLFVDLTGIMRGRVGRTVMPRVLDVMESRSAAILRGLFNDPRLSITRHTPWLFLRRVLRLAFRHGIPAQVILALLRPEPARARIERLCQELPSRLMAGPRETTDERIDIVEKILLNEIVPFMPKIMPPAALGLGLLSLAGKLLAKDAEPGDLPTVLRGLPHNITTEMDLSLWELAASIQKSEGCAQLVRDVPAQELSRQYRSGTLPPPLQSGVAGFLSKFGHRAVAEIDIGMPRWSDDPSHIFGVLANYLRLENPDSAPDAQFERGAAAAEAMIGTLVDRARRRGRLRAAIVRFALTRSRQLSGLREVPKYYAIVALAAVRRELKKIGEDLVRRGAIDIADDVFFLDLKETRTALQGQPMQDLIVARRQSYELELRRRHVPNVMLSDGTEPETQPNAAAKDDQLAGTPASSGTVTGIARVVFDPVGAHLQPGEILVVPSTDPGWTPLFLTAGGLVMEMGGANSHGAVVAREYGIPAVVGVPQATARILTGQRVIVDGAHGIITLGEKCETGVRS
jgi:rifampicin phosphotransferase